MGERDRTIVVSDIHMGTNAPTCWYQKAFHEPYLVKLLDWIVEHKDEIRELVILGDLFDFWTYPPTVRPPTMKAIVEANPNVLGPTGKLSSVLDALGDRVVYLHGNHDMNVTQEDLNQLGASTHKVRLVADAYVSGEFLYTHGHLSTMFNAPYRGKLEPLPVGHFVTRCISHMLQEKHPRQTAADLPDQGAPYDTDWDKLIQSLIGSLKNIQDPSIAAPFLDYIARRTGMDQDAPITLADGTTATIREAKQIYVNLWSDWVAASGGGTIGKIAAYKAARADYDGSYLGWFAERLRREKGARAVVMGHTHRPRKGLRSSKDGPCAGTSCVSEYCNSGFFCPSKPDVAAGKQFSFASVSPEAGTQLMAVVNRGGAHEVEPLGSVPSEWILEPPALDYSCYVEVRNQTGKELRRSGAPSASHGYHLVEPPVSIPPGARALFWIQDLPGPNGATGSVAYTPEGGGTTYTLKYSCPMPPGWHPFNSCSGAPFRCRSGTGAWGAQGVIVKTGHPFFVEFTVGGA